MSRYPAGATPGLGTDRTYAATAVLLVVALLLLAGWWQAGRPVELPSAGSMPLQCVSYAPSASTEAPGDDVSRAHIERDLRQLAQQFRCVRTYSVSHGLDAVPQIARGLGLRVLLGVWISGDAATNEREIARAVATARRERTVIDAIIVGNEVLLRHELPASKLAPLIERVGRETGLPVTYADVWGRWIPNRELARSVSFVTVHILPYWDDEPVPASVVMPYVESLYDELQALFPGKALFVGETGWPSAGKPRSDLEPGRVNQARYLRSFTALAERRGIRYNLIEAYDQPWKRAHEGTVGGHWGILDARGNEKFSWSGPVVESAHARWVVTASVALASLGALFGGWLGGPRRFRAAVLLGSCMIFAVCVAARQVDFVRAANITWADWTVTLLVAATGWAAFAFAMRGLLSGSMDHRPLPRAVTLLLLAACAYYSLGLVMDGRHRDLPVWLFLPAVVAFLADSWVDPEGRVRTLIERRATEETLLAVWLALSGVLVLFSEGVASRLALGWAASCAALGLSLLLPLVLQSRRDQRPTQHADR
jgi:glucan 1,3-beta-glucosidase